MSAKLAALITLKRREDKLSQTQLGEILDVDQTTVSNYERAPAGLAQQGRSPSPLAGHAAR